MALNRENKNYHTSVHRIVEISIVAQSSEHRRNQIGEVALKENFRKLMGILLKKMDCCIQSGIHNIMEKANKIRCSLSLNK